MISIRNMNILAIETSCDETAAAIIKDGNQILSNVVVSQIDIFAAYGGVIPEVAARSHLEAMLPVVHKAFADADFITSNDQDDWSKIDAIAVTHTPGLLGSLLIGTLTARTLAILHDKPLYAVHHLKSHIYACWLNESEPTDCSSVTHEESLRDSPVALRLYSSQSVGLFSFPILALVISGGHTQIIYMREHNHFEIIGTTRDDAIGECFDKVAKILGLPYPGGPAIAKAAEKGDSNKYKLPHPRMDDLDFSFSGLKTAVLRAVQKECNLPISHPSYDLKNHLSKQQVVDFAASFQKTAIDILLEKLQKALSGRPEVKTIVFAGGVAANAELRKKAKQVFCPTATQSTNDSMHEENLRLAFPALKFTGDNAAMVGAAAFYEIQIGAQPVDPYKLDIFPRSPIF